MNTIQLARVERSVARIATALGELVDWKDSPCKLHLLALGMLVARVPDGRFAGLLRKAAEYERANPVTGHNVFDVYSTFYLGYWSDQQAQLCVSAGSIPVLTEAQSELTGAA